MKNLKHTLAALALLPSLSFAGAVMQSSSVPVNHVFTPAGFDSNDSVELVVTGYLPNLCFKAPQSQVYIKDGKINVSVKANKNQNGLGFCADVIVPFIEHIKVGVLDKGKYEIVVNENTSWAKRSSIAILEASSNSIDEVIYADVDDVVREDEGSRKVLLKGYNPSDCFELKEIVVLDNGVDTYSILPKMKQVRAFCPKKMIPFTYEMDVPEKLVADKVLLHVRVMDGRAVNTIFNNKPLME
ncbi:MAG: hypothetical protein HOP07_08220 [Bacteriovoracaceae bacterium]|nr:hypothetical protein [Bacteriovoracaceae bacterium]